MVTMRHDVADNPVAASVLDAVHRSFTKPKKLDFTRALLRSIKEFPVYSAAGLYLGHAASYDVDLQRLCRVIERTTRGFYFNEFKVRLPDDQRCKTYALDGFSFQDPNATASVKRLVDLAFSGKSRVFGKKVFAYWLRKIDGPTPVTLWAFVVYSRVVFLALTLPA
jgi:hypothetical protein